MKAQNIAHSQNATGNLPEYLLGSVYSVEKVTGDETRLNAEARERLILEHLPTVRIVARRVRERLPQHVDLDELISAGTVGLIDAAQKFKPSKDVQFASYAQFRIRGAILDSLRTLDWSPRELRRKGREIEQVNRFLAGSLGRAPEENEMAQALGVSLGAYQELLSELKCLEIGSLNEEREALQGQDELSSLQAPTSDDPLYQCLQHELREQLSASIELLPEKERRDLTLRYYEELTMKEISSILGVVESRVSQIHRSALKRLQAGFKKEIPGTVANFAPVAEGNGPVPRSKPRERAA